jgi:hypothetical protein
MVQDLLGLVGSGSELSGSARTNEVHRVSTRSHLSQSGVLVDVFNGGRVGKISTVRHRSLQSLLCECRVPRTATASAHRAALVLSRQVGLR